MSPVIGPPASIRDVVSGWNRAAHSPSGPSSRIPSPAPSPRMPAAGPGPRLVGQSARAGGAHAAEVRPAA